MSGGMMDRLHEIGKNPAESAPHAGEPTLRQIIDHKQMEKDSLDNAKQQAQLVIQKMRVQAFDVDCIITFLDSLEQCSSQQRELLRPTIEDARNNMNRFIADESIQPAQREVVTAYREQLDNIYSTGSGPNEEELRAA